jgi:hypothetical protein
MHLNSLVALRNAWPPDPRSARRSHESQELGGCSLHSVSESFLLGGIADVEVVNTLQHADRAVDQLADDVSVACVTLRVSSDTHQDVMQRGRLVGPPPHASDRIQMEVR